MALVHTTHTRALISSIIANNGCIAVFYSNASCDIFPYDKKSPLHLVQVSHVLYFEEESVAYDDDGKPVANGVILALCTKVGHTIINAWSARSLQSLYVEITQQLPVLSPLTLPFLAALPQSPASASLSVSCVGATSLDRVLAITTENPSSTHIYLVRRQQSTVRIRWHQTVNHKSSPLSLCLTPYHLLVSELGGIQLMLITRIHHRRGQSTAKKQPSDSQSEKQESLFVGSEEPLLGLRYVRSNLCVGYTPAGGLCALYTGWLGVDKPLLIVLKVQLPIKIMKFSLYYNVKLDPENPATVVSLMKDNEVGLFPLKEVLKVALQQENDIIAGAKVSIDTPVVALSKLVVLSEAACDVSCGNERVVIASKQDLFVYTV